MWLMIRSVVAISARMFWRFSAIAPSFLEAQREDSAAEKTRRPRRKRRQ
jgi:hypothetical protein